VRPVPIRLVDGAGAPAVWGLGRPQLLWPSDLHVTSGASVDGLLVHELAHVKRRDHLVGWIELAAGVIWWWNPLFWFARASLREQAELACDAWVISSLPQGRRAYAESLLDLSSTRLSGSFSMAAVGVRAGSRRLLERRLVMIMQGRAPLRLSRITLLSLALVALLSLPAWATSQQAPPPPPPPPPAQVMPPPPPPAPPPPVPATSTRARSVTRTQAPGQVPPTARTPQTPPARRTILLEPTDLKLTVRVAPRLPEEGSKLFDAYTADVEKMRQEAAAREEARHAAFIKSLEALQDEYTKAGKLDEAVAIRDYLRSGRVGPFRGSVGREEEEIVEIAQVGKRAGELVGKLAGEVAGKSVGDVIKRK
jgi:hypothetical protein